MWRCDAPSQTVLRRPRATGIGQNKPGSNWLLVTHSMVPAAWPGLGAPISQKLCHRPEKSLSAPPNCPQCTSTLKATSTNHQPPPVPLSDDTVAPGRGAHRISREQMPVGPTLALRILNLAGFSMGPATSTREQQRGARPPTSGEPLWAFTCPSGKWDSKGAHLQAC